jgi:hypothetical protein
MNKVILSSYYTLAAWRCTSTSKFALHNTTKPEHFRITRHKSQSANFTSCEKQIECAGEKMQNVPANRSFKLGCDRFGTGCSNNLLTAPIYQKNRHIRHHRPVFGGDNAGEFGVSALKTYSDTLVELFKPRARRRLLVDAACERIL